MEQTEIYPAPTTTAKNHRFGPKGLRTRLQRGLILGLYLPLLILARWLLTTARVHGEARSLNVTRNVIELPELPAAFDGLKIVFLTDFHCSAQTPPAFLERVVEETNNLKADLILLGGDYVTEGTAHIRPIEKLLARLKAPLGVYGVLGNHDFDGDAGAVRSALKRAGIVELTNSGCWLTRSGTRIRIAGVGDLWEDTQDLPSALAGVKANEVAIVLSHNPDYAVEIADPRVRLVLSGHTHGGQISLPRVGPLITNSRYGRRLVNGLISFPSFQLYVSRGLGTVLVPFRYDCPPEITIITLRRSS